MFYSTVFISQDIWFYHMHIVMRLFILLLFVTSSACSVNPVTGEQNLLLPSKSEDIQIGNEQYKPTQQSQGGQYTLDPELSAYVTQVGQKLAKVSDQPSLPYEFVILNNSVPNAWALPSGKIAINRGLLTRLNNEAQLAAVLSHEIVHAAARYGAQRMRDSRLMQAGLAGLNLGLKDHDYRELIIGSASLGANLTVAKYGRDHELESDHFGMKYMALAGYDLQGAIELQKLFVQLSRSSSNQSKSWLDGLFASHPPSQERVSENIKTAQALNTSGAYMGEQAYTKALAYLHSKLPAYDLADQAALALHNQRLNEALSLINKAIVIEPREAQFLSLKGEIYQQSGKPEQALQAHNQSIELNSQQFSAYLRRAESYQSLGQTDAATADYQHSMRILPTSVAALALGNLFQQSGNKQMAIGYYAQAVTAAGQPGQPGQQASIQLARLEIHEKPEKYLSVNHVQDPKGPLLVIIENHSAIEIKALTLTSELFNASGALLQRQSWQTRQTIPAGQRSRYYPVPVSYHLQQGHSVSTHITEVKLN